VIVKSLTAVYPSGTVLPSVNAVYLVIEDDNKGI
jgi:hypothetical protein